MTPQAIIEAVQNRGNDATTLRDAIHEAHHAIEAGAESWDRDSIHEAVERRWQGRSELPDRIRNEIEARAAEWAACDAHGIKYKVEHWHTMMVMEAVRDGIHLPYEETLRALRELRRDEGDELYRRVVAFLEAP